jgi:hypothetical protein
VTSNRLCEFGELIGSVFSNLQHNDEHWNSRNEQRTPSLPFLSVYQYIQEIWLNTDRCSVCTSSGKQIFVIPFAVDMQNV